MNVSDNWTHPNLEITEEMPPCVTQTFSKISSGLKKAQWRMDFLQQLSTVNPVLPVPSLMLQYEKQKKYIRLPGLVHLKIQEPGKETHHRRTPTWSQPLPASPLWQSSVCKDCQTPEPCLCTSGLSRSNAAEHILYNCCRTRGRVFETRRPHGGTHSEEGWKMS